MICRKCGAEIPDNSMRCHNCGVKVNMYCPNCRTLNPFGEKHCINCSTELLLSCSVCGSTNIYYSNECRKCHSPLIKQPKPDKKSFKDIQVVESFSTDESAFMLKDIDGPVIIKQSDDNGLPVIEKANVSYSESEIKRVFGTEKEFVEVQDKQNEHSIPIPMPKQETSNDNEDLYLEEVTVQDEEINKSIENTEPVPIIDEPIEEQEEQPAVDDREEETKEQVFNAQVKYNVVTKVANIIKNSLQKHIIAINGPEGSGKSAVLKQVSEYLSKDGYLSLYGSCTPLVKITGFGFFQDALLRILGFPPFTKSFDSFTYDFKNSHFSKVFSFLNEEELDLFLNIFYPSKEDSFDNIIQNKIKIFSVLEKVIKSFLLNNNLLIIIDNFDALDGASYDFIVYMLKNGFFNNRLKLLAAYQENKDIKSYFELSLDEEKMFETIELNKFNRDELLEIADNSVCIKLEEVLDKDTIDELIKKADGNALQIEQEAAYLFDNGYLKIENDSIFVNNKTVRAANYGTFEELIKKRINSLSPIIKNLLFTMAIMGYRFSSGILLLTVTAPNEKAQEIIDFLVKNLFIRKVDSYTYEFKSLNLWELVYQEAKKDLLYKENAQKLYSVLKQLLLSSNLQKLISCSPALTDKEEFKLWSETSGISAYLGDTNLYVIAKKQCLKILDKFETTENSDFKGYNKNIIYEEIGKLLYEKSPKEAVTYLSNVLDECIKNEDINKVIDISGYFVKSCYLIGNYFGAVEAVDSIIEVIQKSNTMVSAFDLALIKTRKLNALLNIGHCEEIINLVENDIMNELDKNMLINEFENDFKDIILNAWFNSMLVLLKAYILQGNVKAIDVIEKIENAIIKNEYNEMNYKLHLDIAKALSKTVFGEIHKSNEILNNISLTYKNKIMEPKASVLWNLINIINRILLNRNKDLKVDLFELAAFANNINEHFIKNIIKLFLGYVLKIEGNTEKAEEIYNEQVIYFAKEKAAFGAMLAWALIIQQYIDKSDYEKALDTAIKSLEIAQGAKINNYLFITYFQKLIADIYIEKSDYEAAKMYLEQAIDIANKFNLKYVLIHLYLSFAKCIQEIMKYKRIYSNENLEKVQDMYKKAIEIAKEFDLQNLSEIIQKEYSSFKTFCQLNSLDI